VRLTTDRNILVVECSRKDGKELAKWVALEQICDDILHGKRSPLIKIPMCHQRKAVKGRMQRKRNGKTMAASAKTASDGGSSNFRRAVGSAGNSASGRCASDAKVAKIVRCLEEVVVRTVALQLLISLLLSCVDTRVEMISCRVPYIDSAGGAEGASVADALFGGAVYNYGTE
jgi:hypothetical protein